MATSNVNFAYMEAHFPALGLVASDSVLIDLLITWAETDTDATVWKTKLDQGVSNLTAHFFVQNKAGGSAGAGGQITQEKVGDLSRSFNATDPSTGGGNLGETTYGRFYLSLLKTLATKPLIF